MARVHFWSFLVDEEGRPIQGANIDVYLAASTSPAFVYDSETALIASNTVPQTTTNHEGYFEFWVGDVSESFGYSTPQKFRIEWTKTGLAEGFIEYLDILPPATRYFSYTMTTWTSAATGVYVDVGHSMKTLYPLVQVYDATTYIQEDPWKIEGISTIVTRIWYASTPATDKIAAFVA